MVKPLPTNLSEEKFLKLNYANCRFMKSKKAYRTSYNPTNIFFTAKLEEGNEGTEKIKMLHLHLRTPAEDRWFNEQENLDIDIYIPESEFSQITHLLKSEQLNQQITHEKN